MLSTNFVTRTITAIILLTLVITIFLLGKWTVYFSIMSIALLSCKEIHNLIKSYGITYLLLTMIMVVIPYSALMYLYSSNQSILIWLMLCIWTTDISAYCFGKKYGGKKILPSISPNKTWSGLIGAIIMSTICGIIVTYTYHLPNSFLLLGGLIAIISQIGDFFESMIKRIYKASDSGSILPGHGGILDRMDGIIFTAPFLSIFFV